ncbi:DUF551 domain-containing protein [Delftia tsuruhatensis]|uniref:DUF551 domain-containing protein n=1 Tax=Delftia tsuruhatensis TaxID=180282 RepID=UPI00370BB2CC
MTTAPTPSRADALIREHRASMHQEILCAWASDAVDELGRLQADNERLLAQVHKLEMDALDLASENSILKRAETDELEARKPLPLSDWINADERRPEAYLDVLVVIDGKWVTTGEWLHAQKTWCWEQTGDEPDESRVTHWMHMPSPPAHGITGGPS